MTATINETTTSDRMERSSVRIWPGIAAGLLIGTIAFILSFDALRLLFVACGINPTLSWGGPVCVDGTILLCTWATWGFKKGHIKGGWYPWAGLVLFSAFSIAGNALHALIGTGWRLPEWVPPTIMSIPPVALLYATHLIVIVAGNKQDKLNQLLDAPDSDTTQGVDADPKANEAKAQADADQPAPAVSHPALIPVPTLAAIQPEPEPEPELEPEQTKEPEPEPEPELEPKQEQIKEPEPLQDTKAEPANENRQAGAPKAKAAAELDEWLTWADHLHETGQQISVTRAVEANSASTAKRRLREYRASYPERF